MVFFKLPLHVLLLFFNFLIEQISVRFCEWIFFTLRLELVLWVTIERESCFWDCVPPPYPSWRMRKESREDADAWLVETDEQPMFKWVTNRQNKKTTDSSFVSWCPSNFRSDIFRQIVINFMMKCLYSEVS